MDAEERSTPYRWRTTIRRYLPWFLIDLGIAGKGQDCEAAGGSHSWYNVDDKSSGCYHCAMTGVGRLWEPKVQPMECGASESIVSQIEAGAESKS